MLTIKVSPNMTSPFEDKTVRIPKHIRDTLKITDGDFIRLRIGNNTPLLMQAGLALADDVVNGGEEYSWVTKSTYSKLTTTNKKELKSVVEEPKPEPSIDVTIGSDPEFFVIPKLLPSLILPANRVGLEHTNQIGSDGNLGELRPSFAKTVDGLIENTRKLVIQLPDYLGEDKIAKAYSCFGGLAAGYHVHLGLPHPMLEYREVSRASAHVLVRCLDYFVGVLSTVGEVNNERRTAKYTYGSPGDCRFTFSTLEYRTPGAYLLRSPALSRGLFSISKLITDDVVTKLSIITGGWKPMTNATKKLNMFISKDYSLPKIEKVTDMVVSVNKNAAIKESDIILKQMQSLRNYGIYQQAIEKFMTIITSGTIPPPEFVDTWKETK